MPVKLGCYIFRKSDMKNGIKKCRIIQLKRQCILPFHGVHWKSFYLNAIREFAFVSYMNVNLKFGMNFIILIARISATPILYSLDFSVANQDRKMNGKPKKGGNDLAALL